MAEEPDIVPEEPEPAEPVSARLEMNSRQWLAEQGEEQLAEKMAENAERDERLEIHVLKGRGSI